MGEYLIITACLLGTVPGVAVFFETCTLLSTPHPFPLPSSHLCSHHQKSRQQGGKHFQLFHWQLIFCFFPPRTTAGVSQSASAGLKSSPLQVSSAEEMEGGVCGIHTSDLPGVPWHVPGSSSSQVAPGLFQFPWNSCGRALLILSSPEHTDLPRGECC